MLVGQIELRKQVDPVGDQALVEIAVAVIQVRVRGQLFRLVLHTEGGVVLDGVVPGQLQVGVADIQVQRHRPALRAQRRNGERQHPCRLAGEAISRNDRSREALLRNRFHVLTHLLFL
ncbi:hypothetical protein D3C81_1936980 [compost metagenome]